MSVDSMEVISTARGKSRQPVATGTRRRRIRPSRARGLRTRTGCLTCRERRVKCDDVKPHCGRCSKADRICRYAPVTQPEGLPSSQQHPNVGASYFPVEASVPVHQDSIESHASHASHESQSQSHSPISLLSISPLEWYDLLARDAISNLHRLNGASLSGDAGWKLPEIALSRRQSPAPDCPEAHFERHAEVEHQHNGIESPLVDQHQISEPWNTLSRIELSAVDIIFFQYYIGVVGPILDLFDTARHFSNVVPHLALRNTGLLKSILAVGAKHMSLGLTDGPETDPPAPGHMATQYYYETLHYLSQTLLYPSYADSREILATATMISTYEMFDADSACTGGDWEQHLRGSFWIQRSQDNDGESVDGLRRAVWWAWLRQDIWAAFQAGRPTLTFWRARKPLDELDSDELATRIVYICGKCVAYAASHGRSPHEDPRPRIEQGDGLLRALDEWHRVLPASYQPVMVAMHSNSQTMFPPIRIHPPNHAGAMQMYHFARATVLLNQPTMGGLDAYCIRDKQLDESVKTVCGIANACQDHESAIAFVNVQALFAVGQFVRSPEMQGELLRTLENMLRISKYPARRLVAQLQKVWGQ